MVENPAAALDAGEIEEAVIGQIDDGRLVGHRGHFHRKLGAAGNAVGDVGLELAGIALLAVRADIGQRDEGRGSLADGGDGPGLAVEAGQPAMQGVGAVIGRQLKARAIQFERAVRDPVGVAADGRAKEAPDREIAGEIVAAEDDIGETPGTIRRKDRLQRRAIA